MANEKRLIDANALMDDVEMDDALYACLGAVDDVRFLVDSRPTVDAVEVVRCKDCVHSFVRYGENETYCGHPDGLNDRLRPDDFCSYRERGTE